MSIKKKLAMGIATGALAVSMIGGGTYAYFSDTEVNNSSFRAGTLDINVAGNDTANAIIDVDNIKPGDTMFRTFKLNNTGSLDVSQVSLTSNYSVRDVKNNNTDDFGNHIWVTITNKNNVAVVPRVKLKDLAKTDILRPAQPATSTGLSNLDAGKSDEFKVKFEFVDNALDQNIFQGDSLKLDWTFDAKQTAGVATK
jgi:spore coat-associated protein N